LFLVIGQWAHELLQRPMYSIIGNGSERKWVPQAA
jgi:hypothetical protein